MYSRASFCSSCDLWLGFLARISFSDMGGGVTLGAVGVVSLLSSFLLLSLLAEFVALFSLLAEFVALFSLLAELVVLMLKLTSPVGLLFFLQVVNLIPILARRMKAMAPPAQVSGIVRFVGLFRVGKAGKGLAVISTVTLLL